MDNDRRLSLVEQARKVIETAPERDSPPTQEASSARGGSPMEPAPDGYLRRTPVQKIRIPEDYQQRLNRRIAIAAFIGVFVGALVYTLLRFVFFIS